MSSLDLLLVFNIYAGAYQIFKLALLTKFFWAGRRSLVSEIFQIFLSGTYTKSDHTLR